MESRAATILERSGIARCLDSAVFGAVESRGCREKTRVGSRDTLARETDLTCAARSDTSESISPTKA